MRFIVLGVGVLIPGALLLLRMFLSTPPPELARRLRMTGGVLLMMSGVGLLFLRQFMLAMTLGAAGFMMLRREAGLRRVDPTGQRSSAQSSGLDMVLDHDSGEMDGRVLMGRHAGRELSELSRRHLREVVEDLRGDAESLRLLEAYLDRAHPGWRDDFDGDGAGRQGSTASSGRMNAKEAYEILGLQPGAGEAEVRAAHRRLMKQVHPDRGGSAALAAKINEAKDRILGEHR